MVTDTWRGDKRRWFPLETAKRIWCSWAYDGLFIPGVRSFDYFASLGVPRNRIWRGASVVDNDHFCKGSKEAKERETELRKKYGLPEKYFLCVARLSPEKNLVRLLLAFDLYLRHGGNWHLVIVGSGPHSEILRSMALTRALDEVHFVGWQQYSELPVYYGLASVFILPSISEPWGLVVNEAMAAGLPVLVSRQAGCVPELVWRGINGYDFDPWDADALGELMMRMSSGAVDLVGMGEASQRIIANFTPETWADALRDCIHTVACLK
jgi:glycosyltransferase involved in cell wall biosynthesis